MEISRDVVGISKWLPVCRDILLNLPCPPNFATFRANDARLEPEVLPQTFRQADYARKLCFPSTLFFDTHNCEKTQTSTIPVVDITDLDTVFTMGTVPPSATLTPGLDFGNKHYSDHSKLFDDNVERARSVLQNKLHVCEQFV